MRRLVNVKLCCFAVAAEGDNVFESVTVCFTQASNCGGDRHPGGGGATAVVWVGQGTIRVDSVGVTSGEINQLLE